MCQAWGTRESPPPFSFRNTWIRSIALRIPTLALAVDDAHAAFIERAQRLFLAPQQPSSMSSAAAAPLLLSPPSGNPLDAVSPTGLTGQGWKPAASASGMERSPGLSHSSRGVLLEDAVGEPEWSQLLQAELALEATAASASR